MLIEEPSAIKWSSDMPLSRLVLTPSDGTRGQLFPPLEGIIGSAKVIDLIYFGTELFIACHQWLKYIQ